MRVSEIVRSFEEHIAQSPQQSPPRSQRSLTTQQEQQLESREPESTVNNDDDNSTSNHATELIDEAKIKTGADGKEQSTEEQHHTADTLETRQEFREPESSFDIIISHDSELTDEKSGVEVRAIVKDQSDEEYEKTRQEHQPEAQIPEATSDNNEIISHHSELTDEASIRTPTSEEANQSEEQSRDALQVSQGPDTISPDIIDSTHSELTDEVPHLENRTRAIKRIPSPEVNQVHDVEQLCIVRQITKDSLQQQHLESRNHERSSDQDSPHVTFEVASEACEMMSELGLSEMEQVAEHASLIESDPQDAHHEVTQQQVAPESRNPEEVGRSDSDHMEPKDSEYVDIRQLFREMEQSMEARFRRLEETCEQIPIIMEQLQRQVNETKQIDSAAAVTQMRARSIRAMQQVSNTIPRTNDALNITAVTSNETDTSILASFPELQAYVHQLESTSKNAIADVLEESAKNSMDVVEEVPSDESPALSEAAADFMAEEWIESRAFEFPSTELEALPRDNSGDNNTQSHAVVPCDCSEMFAIERFQHEPAAALERLATFLEEHNGLDQACFDLSCYSTGDHRDASP